MKAVSGISEGDVLALVLAGGRGARLGGLTQNLPKPAIPFGGQYRVIDFSLSNCVNSGIRRIGVLTQYQADPIIRHIDCGWRYLPRQLGEFVDIWPAQQKPDTNWYRGTADAVYQNLDMISRIKPRLVLVLAGDHVYQMDYRQMIETHLRTDAKVTVSCSEVPLDDACRFGVMAVNDFGIVQAFDEKPAAPKHMPGQPARALVSMGIYLFDTDTLVSALAHNADCTHSGHDFGHDVIPALIAQGKVAAHRFCNRDDRPSFWFDIGTLDAYHDAHMALLDLSPQLDLLNGDWPMRANCVNGKPVRILDVGQARSSVANTMLSAGCEIIGARVSRSALSENVVIKPGANVSQSVLLPGAIVGEGCHLERAIVDAGCVIASGSHIDAASARHIPGCESTPNGVTLVTRHAQFPKVRPSPRPKAAVPAAGARTLSEAV